MLALEVAIGCVDGDEHGDVHFSNQATISRNGNREFLRLFEQTVCWHLCIAFNVLSFCELLDYYIFKTGITR